MDRLVVSGGRKFDDVIRLESDLRQLVAHGLSRVSQGDCGVREMERRQKRAGNPDLPPERSADAFTAFLRLRLGLTGKTYDADWNAYGDAAGPIRNEEMLDAELALARLHGQQLGVAAYPDDNSTGTWHLLAEAIKRDIGATVWVPWAASPSSVISMALSRRGIRRRVPMLVMGHRVLIPPKALSVSLPQPAREWLARSQAVWQEGS